MNKTNKKYEEHKKNMRDRMALDYKKQNIRGRYVKRMASARAKAISVLVKRHYKEYKEIFNKIISKTKNE